MKVGFMFLLKTRFKWVQRLWLTDIFSLEISSRVAGILGLLAVCFSEPSSVQSGLRASSSWWTSACFTSSSTSASTASSTSSSSSSSASCNDCEFRGGSGRGPGAVETWFLRILYYLSCERSASPATNQDSRVYNQVCAFVTNSS